MKISLDRYRVDKYHDLAFEYRCKSGHIEYILIPLDAWAMPFDCECGETMFPIGGVGLSEEDKQKTLLSWLSMKQ
jgi:hypothetical protein